MASRYDLRAAVRHLGLGEQMDFPEHVRAAIPAGCFLDVLGIEPTRAGPGAATARMRIGPHHLNQTGVAQGGAVAALADAVAGWATFGLLDEGNLFTTLEMHTNLIRAVRTGDTLLAVASPVHAGRTTCVLEVLVSLVDDGVPTRTVARFSCTQLVLEER